MSFKDIEAASQKYRIALEKAKAKEEALTPEERERIRTEKEKRETDAEILQMVRNIRLTAQMREAGYDV